MIDALWFALRKAPRAVWAGLGLLALLGALVAWSEARRTRAYDQGKRDAAAGVAFDSALVARVAAVVAERTAHTDTVTRIVTRTQTEVIESVRLVPDSLKALPEIARLVTVTTRLVGEVDSLKAAHVAERMAWTERAKVDSAALYALRVMATARGDTITALAKRPTRKTAALVALLGIGAGFLGGVTR